MSPAKVFVPKGFWKEPEEEGNPEPVPGFHQMLLTFSFPFLVKKTGKLHLMPHATLVFVLTPFSPFPSREESIAIPFSKKGCAVILEIPCTLFSACSLGTSAIQGPG